MKDHNPEHDEVVDQKIDVTLNDDNDDVAFITTKERHSDLSPSPAATPRDNQESADIASKFNLSQGSLAHRAMLVADSLKVRTVAAANNLPSFEEIDANYLQPMFVADSSHDANSSNPNFSRVNSETKSLHGASNEVSR